MIATGFAWLNELMVWIGRWVPRLLLIRNGNQAVKFGPRGRVTLLSANLVVYWPITHEVILVSTRRRTSEINAQLHGGEAISVMIVYEVHDARSVLMTYQQLSSAIDDFTQAGLRAAFADLDAALPPPTDRVIESIMLDTLRGEFGDHGLEISEVHILARGPVFALKNIGDWATHEDRTLA